MVKIEGYTTKEAAEALGVTEQRVRQLVIELGLEVERFRNVIIISKRDFRKMEARKTKAGRASKKGG